MCTMCKVGKMRKDINVQDALKKTRLHYSVRSGNFKETRLLLEAGANVNVIDSFGNTPLSLACIDNPNVAIVKLLLKYNACVNLERPGMNLLLECVLHCKTQFQATIIKILIEHGKNINSTDRLSNRSCMHIVATTGYAPLAKELLNMGAIINIKDNFNCTPLMLAKTYEHFATLNVMQDYINKSRLI